MNSVDHRKSSVLFLRRTLHNDGGRLFRIKLIQNRLHFAHVLIVGARVRLQKIFAYKGNVIGWNRS